MDSLSTEINSMLSICDDFDVQTDAAEESYKKVQWAELPTLPLEKIYSLVSRGDQIKMSQVCRKWSEGFNSSAVWKNFRFSLTESQLSMNPCPKIKCAKKYSSMFQHVEIDFIRNLDHRLIETWVRRLKIFLDILKENSKLMSSLKIRWPENLFLWDTLIDADDLQKYIKSFINDPKSDSFENQPKQVKLEFHSCYFFSPIFQVIKDYAVIYNEEIPLYFTLRKFVNNIEPMDQENTSAKHTVLRQKSAIFHIFPFLQTEYSFIFERMSSSQSADIDKITSSSPSKIILSCYGPIPQHHQGLKSDSWRLLKESFPELQVELYFETDSPSRREVEFFMVPEMPITQLDFSFTVFKSDHSSIMEIDEIFNHLLRCKINEHLVSLSLAWILPIPDLASTFIPFLQACKKLKCFKIFIVYPANGIDRLLRSWLQILPECLEKVLFDISDVGNEDNHSSLMNRVSKYMTALKVKGLNLEVKLNF